MSVSTATITIGRGPLLRVIAAASAITGGRQTVPILSNVMLTALGNVLSVVATDLEIGVTAGLPAEIRETGACTVNARKLHDIVKQLPEDRVTLKLADYTLTVTSGRSRYKLLTLDWRDYPTIPSPDEKATRVTMKAGVLVDMVERVAFAVSRDQTRLVMGGAYCDMPTSGALRFTASDGHRLARVSRAVVEGRPFDPVILPSRGLAEAKRALDHVPADGDVTLAFKGAAVFLLAGDVVVSMRTIEGAFPDVDNVIPRSHTRACSTSPSELLATLQRMRVLLNERTRGVLLTFSDGKLDVSARNPDLGEASEELETTYRGERFSIGFNAQYLIDVLSLGSSADLVELRFTDDISPGTFRFSDDPDFLYVTMPMRL